MGATATGKTDLAVWLHEQGPFDIISVDSAMVYRGMDIGTAKPTPALQQQVPHGLLDVRDPDDPYSAAEFAKDARVLIAQSHAAGRIPLLVGGTRLYFSALLNGLSALPSADSVTRDAIDAEAASEGWVALHQQLARVDPETAARLHPNDAQRIQRALEVYRLTGQPLSALQSQTTREQNPWHLVKMGIAAADRQRLHKKIATRFESMLDAGLVDEVKGLQAKHRLDPDMPSMRAVGYRQVWEYLAVGFTKDELWFRGVAATRQLARRQLTWLRREGDVHWLDAGDGAMQKQCRQYLSGMLG
ncbi:MAG: tRNA (adenosine(37)-N6)-dimethylallyltransferase MiaA [Gammaproteobacteria bacterium]|nr:tRNA (adenosine(37)-N6)-dimethylallyltransferase MiaA [Gammaproteobacteria bacterium]